MAAACCALVLCGCKDDKPQYGDPMSVRVFGVSGRADLTPGSRLGLFVDGLEKADNVPMTVTENGSILLDKEVKWAFDQSSASHFFVYTPYNESFSGNESVTFETPADQSSIQKLLESNMLTGIASGRPDEKNVTIKLKHAMTAMSVSFDNRTGDRIKSLSVSGFIVESKLNTITGTLTAGNRKKTITPLRVSDDGNTFCFFYVPQDVTPVFNLLFESGKKLALTFDNYCHTYPGSIIRFGGITLTESMLREDVNQEILALSGVNIGQWNNNGIPDIQIMPPYYSLSELWHVEPDKDDNNFFSAYINKVTVTAVDSTDREWRGLILEDSTRAIHVWAYANSKLQVGNTVVGPILGYMEKDLGDDYHISYFFTDYATIGKTKTLPCTEASFSDVVKRINRMEYRRVKLKDVTLKQNFTNARAVFVQDTTDISVICQDFDANLALGVKGNLTGFPVRSGSDVVFMVYDVSQFDSLAKDMADNSFTATEAYGWYDLSDPDTAVSAMSGPDPELNYSVRYFDYGRTMQVTDIRNGEVHCVLVYDCKGTPLVGHEYNVAFNVLGKSALKGSTMYMECVKVDDKTAWLVDRSGKYGLVLAL